MRDYNNLGLQQNLGIIMKWAPDATFIFQNLFNLNIKTTFFEPNNSTHIFLMNTCDNANNSEINSCHKPSQL